jgi:hypothetical protein
MGSLAGQRFDWRAPEFAGTRSQPAAAIKKPGIARLSSSPCHSLALLDRARTMIGLFYFPQARIAFVQHSSCEPASTLALMIEIAKINVSKKQQKLPRGGAAGSPEKFEYPCR